MPVVHWQALGKWGGGALPLPDLQAVESINRIPSNNGSWEADRDGFVSVRAGGVIDGSAYSYIGVYVYISGTIVDFRVVNGARNEMWAYYPVVKGDVVQLSAVIYGGGTWSRETFACWYVPFRMTP